MSDGVYVSNRFALSLIGVITVILFLMFVPVIMSWMSDATVEDMKADLQQHGYTAYADQDGNFDVDGDLEVTGDVTATSYYGDGSHLTGVAGTSETINATTINTTNFTATNTAMFSGTLTIPTTQTPSDIDEIGRMAFYIDNGQLIVGNDGFATVVDRKVGGVVTEDLLNRNTTFNDVYPVGAIEFLATDAAHPHALVINGTDIYCGFWTGNYKLIKTDTSFSTVNYCELLQGDATQAGLILDMIVADSSLWVCDGDGWLFEVDLTDPSSYTPMLAYGTGSGAGAKRIDAIVSKGSDLFVLGEDNARKFDLTSRTWAASAVSHSGKTFHSAILQSTSSTIFASDIDNDRVEFLDLNLATTGSINVGYTISDNMCVGVFGQLLFGGLESSASPAAFEIDMTNPVSCTIYYNEDYPAVMDSAYNGDDLGGGYVMIGANNGVIYIASRAKGGWAWGWSKYAGIVPTPRFANGNGYGLIEEIALDGTYCYIATHHSSGAALLKVLMADMT